jgi:hypothetical protein
LNAYNENECRTDKNRETMKKVMIKFAAFIIGTIMIFHAACSGEGIYYLGIIPFLYGSNYDKLWEAVENKNKQSK